MTIGLSNESVRKFTKKVFSMLTGLSFPTRRTGPRTVPIWQQNRDRGQDRATLQSALDRIRQAAHKDKEQRFTTLWLHVYDMRCLREVFFTMKKNAAAGEDRVTWGIGTARTAKRKWLASVLRGLFQYYGVPRNSYSMSAFRVAVVRLRYQAISRRSQNGKMSWKRMSRRQGSGCRRPEFRILTRNNACASDPGQEPGALAALAGICAGVLRKQGIPTATCFFRIQPLCRKPTLIYSEKSLKRKR